MKPTLTLLTALLLAPLAAQAQQAAPDTVRDRLWLFACPPNADAGYLENAGIRGGSRMTPVEGAHWLGVPNVLFITQGWKSVNVAPQVPAKLERMKVRFPTVAGPMLAEYEKSKGYRLTVPKGVEVKTTPKEGITYSVEHA